MVQSLTQPRIILGIDPGTLIMGYGIIKVFKNTISLLEMGVLQLSKYKDHAQRLHLIHEKISGLMLHHQPTDVAIEAPFFGKNVQSMLKLGRAQGVAIAAAMSYGQRPTEYAPRRIKQTVTGRGNATKEQVWSMLQTILAFEETPQFMDATDAVSVALCHYYETKKDALFNQSLVIPQKKKLTTKTNWNDFLKNNPDRVKK